MRQLRSQAGWSALAVTCAALAVLAGRWAVPARGDEAATPGTAPVNESSAPLEFAARSRTALPETFRTTAIAEAVFRWNPHETAIVICDMWDQHWCPTATARVAAMAPRMNELLRDARQRGVFIVHAPSDCMKFYEGTPQRERARRAATAANLPKDMDRPCNRLPGEPNMPADASDGGCDTSPQPRQHSPWRRQIATLEIATEDAVSDSGREIWNLFVERSIQNVLLMGVHTNMCVVGRSFGLRQMVRAGKQVVLVRDLTDAMYNPERPPYVSHCRGTELILGHIEQYICPTTTADDVCGEARPPHVLFMIGEDEYDTRRTLPNFAQQVLEPRGLRSTFVHAAEDRPDEFPGLEALRQADLLVLSVRRRLVSDEQIALVREHLEAGKPLVGIRTASHAFESRNPAERQAWPGFDEQVLGADYQGHYGNKPPEGPPTHVQVLADVAAHPLLVGIAPGELSVTSHLYKNRSLHPPCTVLMTGHVENDSTIEPVTWTHIYRGARVAYTSLGNPDDFQRPEFCRLLANAIDWALERPVAAP